MKLHEFYQAFANTPIDDRIEDIGGITLRDIYRELKTKATIEREKDLLKLAAIYYIPQRNA